MADGYWLIADGYWLIADGSSVDNISIWFQNVCWIENWELKIESGAKEGKYCMKSGLRDGGW